MGAIIIKGEAGKALDAAARGCPLLKIRDLSLREEAMADDTMAWTSRTQDITAGRTILPDMEQAISFYQDGRRIFAGHVSEARDMLRGTRVTVSGPWYWLRKIQLTTDAAGTDKPTIEFPQQSVKTSITTLLTRAIAKGVPMRIGVIDSMLTVPAAQYSEGTFADVLAELLRLIPDGVGWWDYSGTGLPSFNVTRRANAPVISYDVSELVEPFEITAATELEVKRSELTYYTRNATGVPVLQVQAYGAAAPGKVQVVAISGPERDTFVPKDDIESFTVQTTDANVTMNTLRPTILNMLPEVIASRNTWGKPTATDVTLANAEVLQTNSVPQLTGSIFYHQQPALVFTDATTGVAVSRVGKHLITTPEVPEWLSLPGMQRVKITGRVYVLVATTSAKSPYGISDMADSTPPPAWATAFAWSTKGPLSSNNEPPPAWSDSTSFPQAAFYNRHRNQIWALDFEIEAAITTTSYAVATLFAKPQDFEYLTPPAGMAKALQEMQAKTPYRGTLTRRGVAVCDGRQLLGNKFNVTGARAALATMDAQPKAISYDFRSKTVSIELGPPARFDTRSLATRFRQTAQTNIKYNA